jgi:hypothetical protein
VRRDGLLDETGRRLYGAAAHTSRGAGELARASDGCEELLAPVDELGIVKDRVVTSEGLHRRRVELARQ